MINFERECSFFDEIRMLFSKSKITKKERRVIHAIAETMEAEAKMAFTTQIDVGFFRQTHRVDDEELGTQKSEIIFVPRKKVPSSPRMPEGSSIITGEFSMDGEIHKYFVRSEEGIVLSVEILK